MRDDAFQRVNGNITYHVDKVTNNFKRGGARLVQGHFMAPWYLNQVRSQPLRHDPDPRRGMALRRPVFCYDALPVYMHAVPTTG